MIGKENMLAVANINKLYELFMACEDVFSWEGQAIGRYNDTQHEIRTDESISILIPPRCV